MTGDAYGSPRVSPEEERGGPHEVLFLTFCDIDLNPSHSHNPKSLQVCILLEYLEGEELDFFLRISGLVLLLGVQSLSRTCS